MINNNVVELNQCLLMMHLFLNHYFENLYEWKNGENTKIALDTENWYLEIYDGDVVYERWTIDDIKDYLNRNNISM